LRNQNFNSFGILDDLMISFNPSPVLSNYSKDSAELGYNVNFTTTGIFYVWVYGQGGNNKGIHIGLDNVEIIDGFSLSLSNSSFAWNNTLIAGNRCRINVTEPGVHLVSIWARDSSVSLKSVLLTTNPSYIPQNETNFSTSTNRLLYNVTVQVNSSEGNLPISFWYRHNKTSTLIQISSSFDVAVVEYLQIQDYYPRALVDKKPFNLYFLTNSTNFVNPYLRYYLKFNGKIVVELQRNSNKYSTNETSNIDSFSKSNISLVVTYKSSNFFVDLSNEVDISLFRNFDSLTISCQCLELSLSVHYWRTFNHQHHCELYLANIV
jgi:hypothetical protein